jgi:hypothetical protein
MERERVTLEIGPGEIYNLRTICSRQGNFFSAGLGGKIIKLAANFAICFIMLMIAHSTIHAEIINDIHKIICNQHYVYSIFFGRRQCNYNHQFF